MNFQKYFDDNGDRPASGRNLELEQATDRLSRFQRISWKQALRKIATPAFRLHRYRNAHNRLLQNAWCELDSRKSGDCNA